MFEPKLIPLQKIETKEGELYPLYKDWDSVHDGYIPKMVYATTLSPAAKKGPILHRNRQGFMTCIVGEIIVECLVEGKLKEYALLNKDGTRNILIIPKNIPNLIKNVSNKEKAILINLPDRAWHPEDEDTEKFLSWEKFLNEQA